MELLLGRLGGRGRPQPDLHTMDDLKNGPNKIGQELILFLKQWTFWRSSYLMLKKHLREKLGEPPASRQVGVCWNKNPLIYNAL